MYKTLGRSVLIIALLFLNCCKKANQKDNVTSITGPYAGKYLLFDADEAFNTGQSVYPSPYTSIYYANIDGSGITRVTGVDSGYYSYRPSWSPDGKQIVFIRGNQSDSYRAACIIDVTGANFKSVVQGNKVDFPSFTPDDTKLIYAKSLTSTTPYNYDIYVSNTDGTNEQRLTNFADDNGAVANIHCALSGKIYFSAHSDHVSPGVYSVNADGSGLKYLLTDVDFLGISPNGARILFDLGDGLYVCDGDGSNIQKIIPYDNSNPNMLVGACWAPDNTEIYLSNANYPTIFGIFRINSYGYGLQQLMTGYYEFPQVF